jgi:leucyl-tRNA synthetase
MRTHIWAGLSVTVGPTIFGRVPERLDHLYVLLYGRTLVTWYARIHTPYSIISLADSGIGSIDGKVRGKLDITPEQMTDEIWEYIFINGPWPVGASLSKEKADALKHEYEYFYPFDVRSSGKDLINNHLSFAVYNHAAIFPESKWPLSMRANGHILLNGQKMSKSKGNSLTLREAVEKFGADATRLAMADAGDGIEDANFEEKNANANILRIHTLLLWCEVSLVT